MSSSGECRVPQFRHRRIAPTEFARDELFIRINGQQQYLWRAVDQDGDVIDILTHPFIIARHPRVCTRAEPTTVRQWVWEPGGGLV